MSEGSDPRLSDDAAVRCQRDGQAQLPCRFSSRSLPPRQRRQDQGEIFEHPAWLYKPPRGTGKIRRYDEGMVPPPDRMFSPDQRWKRPTITALPVTWPSIAAIT